MMAYTYYDIYCDESSQTQHKYLVIGASVCRSDLAKRVENTIDWATNPFGGTSELKWQKVKKHSYPMYDAAVEAYFKMLRKEFVHFHCLVVDMSQHDARIYGDRELGFTRLLFTLLFKFVRIYRSNTLFNAYLDDRTTQHTPERMRPMLNAKAKRDLHITREPFRRMHFRKSEESRLIQMTDVIAGAIAYQTNKHGAAVDAAAHKIAMAERVVACAGVPSLAIPTPYSQRGFSIWHLRRDPRKRVLRA